MPSTPTTHFTFTDVSKRSSIILEDALKHPVTLTKNGRERLVVMPIEQYRAQFGERPQRAFSVANAPDEVHAEVMSIMAGAKSELDHEG